MLASAWPPFFLDSHHSFLWKQNGVCLSSGKAHLQDRILNTRARNRIALSLSLCLCPLSHTCSPPSPAAGPAKQRLAARYDGLNLSNSTTDQFEYVQKFQDTPSTQQRPDTLPKEQAVHDRHTCTVSFKDSKSSPRSAAPPDTLTPRNDAASTLRSALSNVLAPLHDPHTKSYLAMPPQAIVRLDSAKSLFHCASPQQITPNSALVTDPRALSRPASKQSQVPARMIPVIDTILEKTTAASAACDNFAHNAQASTYTLYEPLSRNLTANNNAKVDKANVIAKIDRANNNAKVDRANVIAKADEDNDSTKVKATTNEDADADATTSVEANAKAKVAINAAANASRCSKPPSYNKNRATHSSTPTGTPVHTPRERNPLSPSRSPTPAQGSGSGCAQSFSVLQTSPTPPCCVDPKRTSCLPARASDDKDYDKTVASTDMHAACTGRRPNVPTPAHNSSGNAELCVGSIERFIDEVHNTNSAATTNKHSVGSDRKPNSVNTTNSSNKKTMSDIAPTFSFNDSTTNPTEFGFASRHSSAGRAAAAVLQDMPRQHILKQRSIEEASTGAIRLRILHVNACLRAHSCTRAHWKFAPACTGQISFTKSLTESALDSFLSATDMHTHQHARMQAL